MYSAGISTVLVQSSPLSVHPPSPQPNLTFLVTVLNCAGTSTKHQTKQSLGSAERQFLSAFFLTHLDEAGAV